MAAKSKNLNLILLCCALIGAIVFFGCGGGSSSDPLPSGPAAPLQITGKVTSSGALASMHASMAADEMPLDLRAAISAGNVEVYLESNRADFNTRTDEDGNFVLSGIPEGSHRVVAVIVTSANRTFKVRSNAISVTRSEPTREVGELGLQEAKAVVAGVFRNTEGEPITNARLLIWGEPFWTDGSGRFQTPPMPNGTIAEIQSEISGYQPARITMEFNDDVTPFIEQTVVTTDKTNRAPTAFLKAGTTEVSTRQEVVLTAAASDPDNDQLRYNWTWTHGELATSTDLNAIWRAPEYDTNAKIVFTANDGNLTATASVDIKVGGGGSGARPPTIVSVTPTLSESGQTVTGSQLLDNMDYEFAVVATDAGGSSLFYYWTIPSGVVSNNETSVVSWRTPVVESQDGMQIPVKLEVTNMQGAKAEFNATYTVVTNPSPPPYRDPLVTISSPANAVLVPPAFVQTYSGSAIDHYGQAIPATGLRWSERVYTGTAHDLTSANFTQDDLIASSVANFTRGNTVPATYAVLLEAFDENSVMGEKVIYYRVNSNPTAQITGPSQTLYQLGDSITFTGTGSDIEDGMPTLAWTFPTGETVTGATVIKSDMPAGASEVRLQAVDSLGAQSAIDTIDVYVNTPPTISSLTPPPDVATVRLLGQPATLSADITDPDEIIASASIRWFNGPTQLGTGYQLVISTLTEGTQEISLRVNDSMGGFANATTSIIINATPTVTIDSPANNSMFQLGDEVTFTASGEDLENITLTWTFADEAQLTGASVSKSDLPAGTQTVVLDALDGLGAKSESTSISLFVNTPPTISSVVPATQPQVLVRLLGEPATFSATITDPDETIIENNIVWTRAGTELGRGSQIVVSNIPVGTHDISLSVTDMYGGSANATTSIIINEPPTMTINTPAADGWGFVGQPIEFDGSGLSRAGVAIDASTMRWQAKYYVEGVATLTLKTGEANFTYTFPTNRLGEHIITFRGADGFGDEGYVQQKFYVNATPTVSITQPASGTRFDLGEDIVFKANANDADPTDELTVRWYSSAMLLGTGEELTYTPELASGPHQIFCRVTDKFGVEAVASIGILVNTLPVATITYSTTKYADGPDGVPVFISEGSTMDVSFSATTFDEEISRFTGFDGKIEDFDADKVQWHINAVDVNNPRATGKDFNATLDIGRSVVILRLYDTMYPEFENQASATITFPVHVWKNRTVTFASHDAFSGGATSMFSSITSANGGDIYMAFNTPNNEVRKITYAGNNNFESFALADTYRLDATATQSYNPIISTVFHSSKVYALGLNASSTFGTIGDHMIMRFHAVATPETPFNPGFANATTSMDQSTARLYLSLTGAQNRIITVVPATDQDSGGSIAEVVTEANNVAFNNPIRVRYSNRSYGQVFVADKGNNRVVRFNSQYVADAAAPISIANPHDMAFNAKYMLVLDQDRVLSVVNPTTRAVVMSFGGAGTAAGTFNSDPVAIYSSGPDLFVLETDRMHVIRSGMTNWIEN